ncbi:MAG TPA: hypothetical protein VGC42_09225, partial [Kofleriaceae bacterium]
MPSDLERPRWKGQRPWLEMWFAVVHDAGGRRALWIRQTLFVPPKGEGRATIWGAWFDADAQPVTRAAKRLVALDQAVVGTAPLIQIEDSWLSSDGALGQVPGLAWDVRWTGGRQVHDDVASWLPAPTHAQPIRHDADATGAVTIDGQRLEIAGRASAIHLWGKRRMPTLHWIYAPWLGDGSLEIQAISLSDRLAMGLASLRLDDHSGAGPRSQESGLHKRPTSLTGRPATSAHPSGLITSTV